MSSLVWLTYLREQKKFCYVNSKSARKKLVAALFGVPRQALDLLPMYARLVAILDKVGYEYGNHFLYLSNWYVCRMYIVPFFVFDEDFGALRGNQPEGTRTRTRGTEMV